MTRAWTATGCFAALVALGLTWHAANVLEMIGPPELGDMGLEPGMPVVLTLGTVISVGPGSAMLHKAPQDYTVLAEADWQVGEDWSVGGTWTGKAIEATWIEEHPGRGPKKALGVFGLLLCVGLVPLGIARRNQLLVLRG